MFELKVLGEFSGAHRLREYEGKCENLHGHNWKVELTVIARDVGSNGLVVDFKVLKQTLKKVLSGLDHRYLNSIPYFRTHNPTSECTAAYIFGKMKKLLVRHHVTVKQVTVWETDRQCATYSEA